MNELTQAVYDLLSKTLVNPSDAAALRTGLEDPQKMNKPTYAGLFLLSLDARSRHIYGLTPIDQLDKPVRNEIKRIMRASELFIVPGWGVMQRRTEEVPNKAAPASAANPAPPAKKKHTPKHDAPTASTNTPAAKEKTTGGQETSRITQSVVKQLTLRVDDREVARKIRREIEHPQYMTASTHGLLTDLRSKMSAKGVTHNLQDGLLLREVERLIVTHPPVTTTAEVHTDTPVTASSDEVTQSPTADVVESEVESLTAEA